MLFHTAASLSSLCLRFFRGGQVIFLVQLSLNYLIILNLLRVIRDLIAQLSLPNLSPAVLSICLPLYLLSSSSAPVQLFVRLHRLLYLTDLRHVHLEQVDADAPIAEDEDLVPAAVGELLER